MFHVNVNADLMKIKCNLINVNVSVKKLMDVKKIMFAILLLVVVKMENI